MKPHDLHGVGNLVEKLMSGWPNERGIYLQLQKLAEFIAKTRSEISSLVPHDVKTEFLVKAADELDAIVQSTATATHRIMDAADALMEVAGGLEKDSSDKVTAAVMSIYEACTFQDITGQRVTKIVSMLKVIEERIDKMVSVMGEADSGLKTADAPAAVPAAPAGGGSDLHGPALPGRGPSQADIDRIFSGD